MNTTQAISKEINYPESVERYAPKAPLKQKKWVTNTAYFYSRLTMGLIRKGYTIEKINMDNIKPPYILLATHMQFMDYSVLFRTTYPHKFNLVAANHTFVGSAKIMETLGCMFTRKYTPDMTLVRSCRKVLQEYKDILVMYPEARYTPDGTMSVLPDVTGKLIKKNKVPVVILKSHGNFLNQPFWSHYKYRKVPYEITMKAVLSAEDVENMSVEEINKIIHDELYYDEYKWQKENNIKITEKYRAHGLHKVLYQCPHCKKEGMMNSHNSELFCKNCGKKWVMSELGQLEATEGETEFSHVPDWYKWERDNVRKELLDGTYSYEEDLHALSLPGVKEFIDLGTVHVSHSLKDGFIITGNYNNSDFRIVRSSEGLYSLSVEYEYNLLKGVDSYCVSIPNDSINCIPEKPWMVTKLSLATEEAFKIANGKE